MKGFSPAENSEWKGILPHGVLKQALAHVTWWLLDRGTLASNAVLLCLRGQEARLLGSPGRRPLVGYHRLFCKSGPAPCSLLQLRFGQPLKLKEEERGKVLFPLSLATNDPFLV